MAIKFINPPKKCDLCDEKIGSVFYDAAVPQHGQWGCICPACFTSHQCRIGIGCGQRFVKDPHGDYVKTPEGD